MILLPKKLEAIIPMASSEAGRYALHGVQVTDLGGGNYSLAATDGKRALFVEGASSPAEFPAVEGLTPGAPRSAVIPKEALRDAFRNVKRSKHKPILGNLAVSLNGGVQLATTDLLTSQLSTPRENEGKFPPVSQIFPAGVPQFSLGINPELCAGLLVAMGRIIDSTHPVVRLDFYGAHRPISLSAVDAYGVRIMGVIMPHDMGAMRGLLPGGREVPATPETAVIDAGTTPPLGGEEPPPGGRQ